MTWVFEKLHNLHTSTFLEDALLGPCNPGVIVTGLAGQRNSPSNSCVELTGSCWTAIEEEGGGVQQMIRPRHEGLHKKLVPFLS